MKALTLYDPWATLVVVGAKQYETRSWGTAYRGPLAIHVSKTFTGEMADLCQAEPYRSRLIELENWPNLGCIIGTVEVVGCYPTQSVRQPPLQERAALHRPGTPWPVSETEAAFGDFTPGRYAWELASPRRLATPIPVRGHQGLWNVPPELITQMTHQGFEAAHG